MHKSSGKENMYTELAEIPIPTSASFHSPDVITVTLSKKIHQRDTKKSISKTFYIAPSGAVSSGFVQDASDVQASVVSPSGARRAILRQTPGDDKPKRFVEIWAGDLLEVSKDVTSTHGAFCTEGEYALLSLSFSPSEDALLYSAEAKDPLVNDADKDIDQYARLRYTPVFGEGFSGKKRPTLYILRWAPSATSRLTSESVTLKTLSFSSKQTIFLGQAVFTSNTHIFATGYEYMESGRLLGIKGCYNRPAGVWEMQLPKSNSDPAHELAIVSRLSPEIRSARAPRVSPDGKFVLWLSNPVGGAHASCSTLHSIDLTSEEQTIVLDTVWEPRDSDGFPGLYIEIPLPPKPFVLLGSKSYIATHSTWGSRSTVVLVSIDGKEVKDLTPNDSNMYSWSVLGTDSKNQIVCVRSAPAVPHEVVLGRLDDNGGVSWQVLTKPTLTPEITKQLATLEASVIPIPKRYPTETILLRTKSAPASTPCICMPHGGPHGTLTTAFSASSAASALAGYTLSHVNYTGSLGFGETYVRKLLGQCGTLDVQDCIASVNHLIDTGVSQRGEGQQFVQGGSHGGFLGAHLIGQFADVFTAACLRNPVISCGEISTTDIPDWYFFEFGLPYDSATLVTPATYAALFAASPIAHVDKVKAKVMLHIGGVDLRVAPTNGVGYYHALKGRGQGEGVDMLVFPKDSHPLDGVETSRICWESARDWFDDARK